MTNRALRTLAAMMLTVVGTQAGSCPPGSAPAPAAATLQEILTDIGRGGRSVAVSISAADPQIAIVGSESGGLFRTTDGGGSWQHIDAFVPFRIEGVAFAEPGSTNTQVVIVTTTRDAQTSAAANHGGIWRSTDAGVTWAHVSRTVCSQAHSAYGIAFSGANSVHVATDCGLLASTDLGATWTNIHAASTRSVVARPAGATTLIYACTQGNVNRLIRSTDGGVTFVTRSIGLACDTPHALAASPWDTNVLFAVFPGNALMESDDGGVTWPTNLGATAWTNRPVWVRTRQAMNGNTTAFNLYFPGRAVECFNAPVAQRCPSNVAVAETWPRLPDNALNHDINGLAFRPASPCPMLMVADYGVYRAGPATPGVPCGAPTAWTHVGRASNGLHSLQIYQVAGQLQFPISGPGTSVGGSTHLFLGTMDNLVWANYNAGAAGWQGYGAEGSFLQVLPENSLLPASDVQLTFMELGRIPAPAAVRLVPRQGGASWNQPVDWTNVPFPGNAMPPVLVGPHTYVQWSNPILFLTTDGGVSFAPLAVLPQNPIAPAVPLATTRFGSTQVTMTSAGPALYEFVTDGTNNGLVLLTQLSPTTPARTFEVRTFGGRNGQGFSSGLSSIMSHCFGQAVYCQPVFAVDPNDYRNLIAADSAGDMVRSTDAGRTWQSLIGLTNLVTMGGALSFKDALGGSQVHAIAYDPRNSQHILVGTDQAGIMASANGGTTWSALPGTTRATAITSFFFDDGTHVVYVATYGRGLWKLTVDWSTVGGP